MKLRPYQEACVEAIFAQLAEVRSTLAVMATGLGKTVVFSHVASRWPAGRVLVMAHREELITQAAAKVEAILGERPGIEMADSRADEGALYQRPKVVVTSVQTMCRENRLARFDPQDFGLVVVDEAHHAPAETYKRVLAHYQRNPSLKVLGVTATPDRADEQALGQVFDSVAYTYEIPDAIRDGYLVPIEQRYCVIDGLDYSGCRTTAGDLNQGDLERVLTEEKHLHGFTDAILQSVGDLPTLIFAASVAHAERMAEILNRPGHLRNGGAVCLHGKTDDELRRRELKRYKAGEYQFLVNCGLFLEGFDEPRIGCVAVARPTKSRALYAQMVGRGTRPLPGVIDHPLSMEWEADDRRQAIAISSKWVLLVLDFVGNSGRHKLISTADILGGQYADEVVERAKARAVARGKDGEPVNMQEELAEVQQVVEEEARRRRRQVIIKSKFRSQLVDPFDVFDVTPLREPGWFKGKRPTEKMLAMIAKAKVPIKADLSFWEAKQLCQEIGERWDNGLCSYNQAKVLAKFGESVDVSFDEASRIIDEIARNGWQPRRKAS